MKSWLVALSMVVAATSFGVASFDADAKRLGGARPSGMQRTPQRQPDASPQTPAQQNAATNAPTAQAAPGTAAAANAAAPRRSWMGPIAGLAAGLGLAALFSHLGWGAGLANFVTIALLVLAVVLVLRFVLRRFGPSAAARQPQLAGAAAATPRHEPSWSPAANDLQRSAWQPASTGPVGAGAAVGAAAGATAAAAAAPALPAGLDAQDFERVAKQIFIRLQAANDAGELDDLRRFTTPELFASLRLDLQERADQPQRTDVVRLDAKLEDTAQEDGQWIASVRFSGLIREATDGAAEPFDELWHLVRPVDGSTEWRIAGITPQA